MSLVAAFGDQVLGHVAFSPVTVDGVEIGLGLGPLAVCADRRRGGVGARLVRLGLASARDAGAGLVVVLGDTRYYSRFGFEPARRYRLSDEYEGGDHFQVIELVPGAIPAGGGLVRYSPELGALEP